MSAFDSIKNLANKAKDYASENADKVNQAVDKGGDFIDSKTGGKYADKIDKAQEAAKKQYNKEPEGQAPAPEGEAPAAPQAQNPAPEGQ